MKGQRIGPYRIDEELGSGGMGEVYRAYDSRLDRSVAIKLIRVESSEKPRSQERFRREARAVAGLNHPAIVQIHDILERPEGACIVMELITGETLENRLAAGPLPYPQVVELGRQIAEGLAAAHDKGIVHRDLKAQNVMISPEGQVKILDFGLAKRLATYHDTETLTVEGRILGTFHAMSPEQAQSFPIDHRSDLFSLGSLLYESLTGKPPFRGANPFEALTLVCTFRPPPAHEVDPQIPPALSELVELLMEKNPDHRPAAATDIAAALEAIGDAIESRSNALAGGGRARASRSRATLSTLQSATLPGFLTPAAARRQAQRRKRVVGIAILTTLGALLLMIAGIALYQRHRASIPPRYVAVLQPEITGTADGEEASLLASGVRVALQRGLLSLDGIAAIASDEVDAVGGTSGQVARALAADEVIRTTLTCAPHRCQISLERVDKTGSSLWAHGFQIPVDDLLSLTTSVAQNLRTGYGAFRLRQGVPDLEVRAADYEAFLGVRTAFYDREHEADLDTLLARLDAVQAGSPRFLEARILEARIASFRFVGSRDPADLKRAYDSIAQARALDPENVQTLTSLIDVALNSERLEEAEEALETLMVIAPGDARVQVQQASILERRGAGERALQLMRQAVARHPSATNLFDLANLAYRNGALAAAKDTLDALLDRYPEHFEARSLLAQLELAGGSPERAAVLFAELVERSPGTGELTNLGVAELLLGRYAAAAEHFRRARGLAPDTPFAVLNLADAELLLGNDEAAAAGYRKVLTLIERDPAASHWQLLTIRAQALARLGQSRDAVAAVQEALQRSPDNPQVAYEVALVYALVGETTSALVNAERALELGIEPVWFRFPAFDLLRAQPTFLSRLETAARP